MSNNGSLTKTIASKFKRLNYFHGMLLTEDDFLTEQAYFRDKLRLHNRLHGSGIVWGLGLTEPEESAENADQIVIEPGVALDCLGNEIVVCDAYTFDLKTQLKKVLARGKLFSGVECPPDTHVETVRTFVCLKYSECKSEPEQQYTSACADDELLPQFARVREGFRVEVLGEKELPPCGGLPRDLGDSDCLVSEPVCPGLNLCQAEEHCVVIGCLKICDLKIDLSHRGIFISESKINLLSKYIAWEKARTALLQAFFAKSGWQDISVIVGRTVECARGFLKKTLRINDKDIRVITISEVDPDLLQQARNALPCVNEGTPVILVSDENQNCVMFVLEASGTEISDK